MLHIKRKIIQIAGSTQLVSLPRKWCKENNVQKGDEVEIISKGSRLMVDLGKEDSTDNKTATLNLDGMEQYLKYLLHDYYQKGYTELVFTYKEEKTALEVQKILHEEMIGFEIVEQKPNSCVVRAVAGALASEFDTLLNRAFNVTLSMFDGIVDVLRTGNILPINSLVYMEATNNKYCMFCIRVLNKNLVLEENTNYLYAIIQRIERLGRELKFFCYRLLTLPNELKEMRPEVLQIFEELQSMLHESYRLMNEFDLKEALAIFDRRLKLVKESLKFANENDVQQIKFIHYAININQYIYDLVKAKVQMEI